MDDEILADSASDEEILTDREFDVLVHIIRYMRANRNKPPDNGWLARRLTVGLSAISNYKKALKEKGFLYEKLKGTYPTEEAITLVDSLPIAITAQVPLLGQVKGGPSERDEIVVDMDSADLQKINQLGDTLNTVAIPTTEGGATIFALQVVGESMQHEQIFDGDYVIIEAFSRNEGPKQGELIVTEYLSNSRIDRELLDDWDNIPDQYRGGPTLKYFYEETEKGYFRLGLRRTYEKTEAKDTIVTKYIQPIGRVIGVYRPLPQKRFT